METDDIKLIRVSIEPDKSLWWFVWSFLQFLGQLAVLALWAWLAVWLWQSNMEPLAVLIAATFVIGIVMAWRALPRAKKKPRLKSRGLG